MSMTYMSVERPTIQKAFALAHKMATNPDIGDRERKSFRAVAYLIWQACGSIEERGWSYSGTSPAATEADREGTAAYNEYADTEGRFTGGQR